MFIHYISSLNVNPYAITSKMTTFQVWLSFHAVAGIAEFHYKTFTVESGFAAPLRLQQKLSMQRRKIFKVTVFENSSNI